MNLEIHGNPSSPNQAKQGICVATQIVEVGIQKGMSTAVWPHDVNSPIALAIYSWTLVSSWVLVANH